MSGREADYSKGADRAVSLAWLALLGAIIAMLAVPASREAFAEATRNHPYLLGFLKIAVLGTMGELLGAKLVVRRWRLRGIRLYQRVLVWGFLGIVFTVVFPLFAYGTAGLLAEGLLPGEGNVFLTAMWTSVCLNLIFAFPMMVFHRITDTLIDRGELFRVWPVVSVISGIDWNNMVRIVGLACLWFWIPAHTITYLLPPEFRVMSAALLAIALGFIMGMAKRRAMAAAQAEMSKAA